MPNTFKLSQFHLANHRAYRAEVLGTSVRYLTPNGNTIEGTLSEHPIAPGGLQLAVIRQDGKWAAVHAGETLETI